MPFLDGWYPVFQMRLDHTADGNQGWALSDEGEPSDHFSAPAFTVALPSGSAVGSRYGFPVEIEGRPRLLLATYSGDGRLTFEYQAVKVRWTFGDWSRQPDMVQTLLPYVGRETAVLSHYGKMDFHFASLSPLDLISMDVLFREHRVVFVGVTVAFGPHIKSLTFSEAK